MYIKKNACGFNFKNIEIYLKAFIGFFFFKSLFSKHIPLRDF